MPCAGVWVRQARNRRSGSSWLSRVPFRLRPELDLARLRELDDDLEIAGFLGKTARLNERRADPP